MDYKTTNLMNGRAKFLLFAFLLSKTFAGPISDGLSPYLNENIKVISSRFSSVSSEAIVKLLNDFDRPLEKLIKIETVIGRKIESSLEAGHNLEWSLESLKNEAISETKDFPSELRDKLLSYVDEIVERKRGLENKSDNNNSFDALYKDLSRLDAQTKEEWQNVLRTKSLDQDNPRVFFNPRRILTRDIVTTKSESFSVQVKIALFGVEFSAGPTIKFERRFVIRAKLFSAGTSPILAYNNQTNSVELNHSDKRPLSYLCMLTAQAIHKLSGSAGLSIIGTGASIQRDKWESILVSQRSGIRTVPLFQSNGMLTSLSDIEKLCSVDYFKDHKGSLGNELKLAASQLLYTNRKNKCAKDSHCLDWHRSLVGVVQRSTVARCGQARGSDNAVNVCQLKGKIGNNCEILDSKSRRLSSGYFEYPCDRGLKCKIVRKGGWFTNGKIFDTWHGQCLWPLAVRQ